MCLLGKELNDYISHYEVLNYNTDSLMSDHRRLTRSISGARHIQLRFNALGRAFNLKLYQGSPSFTSDAVVMVDDRPINHHKSLIYHGIDESNNNIHVGVCITDVAIQMTEVFEYMVTLLEEYLLVKYALLKIFTSLNRHQG